MRAVCVCESQTSRTYELIKRRDWPRNSFRNFSPQKTHEKRKTTGKNKYQKQSNSLLLLSFRILRLHFQMLIPSKISISKSEAHVLRGKFSYWRTVIRCFVIFGELFKDLSPPSICLLRIGITSNDRKSVFFFYFV